MPVALDQYLAVAGDRVVVRERSAVGKDAFWRRLEKLASWLRVEHRSAPSTEPRLTELFGARRHGRIAFVGEIAGRQLRNRSSPSRAAGGPAA